jgi:hypothetical protein
MKKIFFLLFTCCFILALFADSSKYQPGYYTYIQTFAGNVTLYVELKKNGKCDVFRASQDDIMKSENKTPYKKVKCTYNVNKNLLTFKSNNKTIECNFSFVEGGKDERTGLESRLNCKDWNDHFVLNNEFDPKRKVNK